MKLSAMHIPQLKWPAGPERNVLSYSPKPISWFLGYRTKKPRAPPRWEREVSILIATMAGMLVNLAIAMYAPLYTNHWHFTEFVPSFAASCISIYGSVDAPFSQPRNMFIGNFLAALLGICIMKLFMTHSGNEKYLWLGGALSVACSNVIMSSTGTTHPPSGATALLPCINEDVRRSGWRYLPLILVHSCAFFGVALLMNNICRVYPAYWISPKRAAPTSSSASTVAISAADVKLPLNFVLSQDEQHTIEMIQKRLNDAPEKSEA